MKLLFFHINPSKSPLIRGDFKSSPLTIPEELDREDAPKGADKVRDTRGD